MLGSRQEGKVLELEEQGFCVLRQHLNSSAIQQCRDAFWPILLDYIQRHQDQPNRGQQRHFLPMPFEPPCFAPDFFFDSEILSLVRGAMDERVVADQWGCDVPLKGSGLQDFHADYQRPLFPEAPDLLLPPYMLVLSFGLIDITPAHGPIEIVPMTHRMLRSEALQAIRDGKLESRLVTLDCGDVLIRHPWTLHRGTPNVTDTPRALLTIRYVRRWYVDASREVHSIPAEVWESLTPDQQSMMRFPIAPLTPCTSRR